MDRQYHSMFHDGTDRFRHDKDGGVTFVLRCADEDINVFICIKKGEYFEDHHMDLDYKDGGFAYYKVKPLIPEKIVEYFFRVEKDGNKIFYDAQGPNYNNIQNPFVYNTEFKTPDWAKGAVMYQIYVDRFCNGDKTNDVETEEYAYLGAGVAKIEDWYQLPNADDTREFYGGDLQGVIDKLDYLKGLGVEVIYFNPLFVSPSNHKYDTQDYDHIDPHFGKIVNDGGAKLEYGEWSNDGAEMYRKRTTDKENLEASDKLFIKLVEKAHKMGIRVILDGVFNHCGSFNKWLDKEKVYTKITGAYESKDSPYVSFFKFSEDAWPDNYHYENWWGNDTLPKLNYEDSEKLQEYILKIGKKWVSPPFNADGWRLDVAADLGHSEEFNHKFWKRFRKAVKKANPEAIILAEHYGDASAWLKGDEWDTVMNYDAFMEPVTWFLTGMDKHSDQLNPDLIGNAWAFDHSMKVAMSRMQNESLMVAMNELSNHDHSRFLTRTNSKTGRLASAGSDAASEGVNYDVFRQGVIMQMTLPGAPTVYYGDEAGLTGWTDPDNRRTYPWGRENVDLIEFYKKAIKFHKKYEVLKTGSYTTMNLDSGTLSYARFDEKSAMVTAVNATFEPKEMHIPVWKLGVKGKKYSKVIETGEGWYDIKSSSKDADKVTIDDGWLRITVPAKGTAVYTNK
ncbi:MAG: glycoside hydrolase family 13 protein [Eubacterium sp.]|nr:glycoside hydrolase family 13 protein [Eubacterium sp.]